MVPDLSDDVLSFLALTKGVGVAVSGGGDSMALLYAAHKGCRAAGVPLLAASVDHGLRSTAADECAFVAAKCAQLGVRHTVLSWDGTTAHGNLQAAAREARYGLLSDWASAEGINHILLGHTADDQAETLLMAIGRGAGPDGMMGMRPSVVLNGVTYLRPYLGKTRESLRNGLREIGGTWVDDPSNDDQTYQRVRVRKLLAGLDDAGVPLSAFGQVADNMTTAAAMLDDKTSALHQETVMSDRGDYLIRQDVWRQIGLEPARRLVLKIIRDVAGPDAQPRRAEQREILRRLRGGRAATVAGCRLSTGWGMVRFAREAKAVMSVQTSTDQIWDNRWQVDGPHAPDLHVAMLGDGLLQCPDWRQTGLPEASLRASPAIWRSKTLVAAPLAGLHAGWTVQNVADRASSLAGH